MQQIQTILPIKSRPKKSRSFVDLTKSFPSEDASLKSSADDHISQRKFSNPRKTSGVRRPSKTFRKYPEIVIDPPKENVTSSLPDITVLNYPEYVVLNNNNVSEKNSSCPNLTDENVYQTFTSNLRVQNRDFQRSSSLDTSLDSLIETYNISETLGKTNINFDRGSEFNLFSCTGKVFFQYGDMNFEFQKHNKFEINTLECLDELYSLKRTCDSPNQKMHFKAISSTARTHSKNALQKMYAKKGKHKFNYKNPLDERTKFSFEQNVDCISKESQFSKDFASKVKRKYGYSVPKCKKIADVTPADILKHKMKQSVSMQNLHLGSKLLSSKLDFDNYHTIHSDSNFPQNAWNYNLDIRKSDSFDAITENKLRSQRKIFHFPQNSSGSFSYSNFSSNTGQLFSNFRGLDYSENFSKLTEVIYKCCCGRTRCKAVVPIQQYLETYYDERVRNHRQNLVLGGCCLSRLRVLGLLHVCLVCLLY